jgi:hypothetical protein
MKRVLATIIDVPLIDFLQNCKKSSASKRQALVP